MSTPDDGDLDRRVQAVERELERLRTQVAAYASDAQAARTDAQAARVLASGADRDASDVRDQLRAHTRTLNALRETQLEQGALIAGVNSRMEGGFTRLTAGMEGITALLTQIIERDQ